MKLSRLPIKLPRLLDNSTLRCNLELFHFKVPSWFPNLLSRSEGALSSRGLRRASMRPWRRPQAFVSQSFRNILFRVWVIAIRWPCPSRGMGLIYSDTKLGSEATQAIYRISQITRRSRRIGQLTGGRSRGARIVSAKRRMMRPSRVRPGSCGTLPQIRTALNGSAVTSADGCPPSYLLAGGAHRWTTHAARPQNTEIVENAEDFTCRRVPPGIFEGFVWRNAKGEIWQVAVG